MITIFSKSFVYPNNFHVLIHTNNIVGNKLLSISIKPILPFLHIEPL